MTIGSPGSTQQARGILIAAKEELIGGWFHTTRSLVAAELFSDFLQMAEHLLAEGYKDPAAVMAGGVLEEHLRQLSTKAGVALTYVNQKGDTVFKKAEQLNTELAKVPVQPPRSEASDGVARPSQ